MDQDGPESREVYVLQRAGERDQLVATVVTDEELLGQGFLHGSRSGPVIPLDRAVKLAPEIEQLIEGGQVMRVVGGPAGELMKSGGDTLAIARNADGTVAGPLRFDGGPRNLRTVAAPAQFFQIASALTLQHYLDTMSKQLEALQAGVQDIKDLLLQAQKGDLYAVRRFVAQQEQLVSEGTKLGVDLSSAIEGHLAKVRSIYSGVRDSLQRRAEEAVSLVDEAGAITDHDGFDAGLERMMTDGRRDTVTMLAAIDLTVRLLRLQQIAALERGLGQGPGLRQTALEEIAELRHDFEMLSPLFERWLVSDDAIQAHERGMRVQHKFSSTGRLLSLRNYALSTIDLRRLVARPVDEVLPQIDRSTPSYVIECRTGDDGEVYAQIAELEL